MADMLARALWKAAEWPVVGGMAARALNRMGVTPEEEREPSVELEAARKQPHLPMNPLDIGEWMPTDDGSKKARLIAYEEDGRVKIATEVADRGALFGELTKHAQEFASLEEARAARELAPDLDVALREEEARGKG